MSRGLAVALLTEQRAQASHPNSTSEADWENKGIYTLVVHR